MNDIIEDPFMKKIRKWQHEYSIDKPTDQMGNLLTPCLIRDHYDFMLKELREHKAKAIDESGEEALKDEKYQQGMISYNEQVAAITGPVWEEDYLGPERQHSG